ncbi:MAG TPA: DUF429 domain-containing protein [Saprospiraceae bacterium]|nr:DUF429 domain-containing protein [Saprospiraceae bacterium]
MDTWVGVDYGSKQAGTTVLAFAKKGKIHFLQSKKKADADAALHQWIKKLMPGQVFIDAPLSLPLVYREASKDADFFYRRADRELKAMSPMFLGGLTARAMRLVARVEADLPVVFRETYPGYLAKLLDLPKMRYKKEKVHLPELTNTLCSSYQLQLEKPPANWHQFDALLAYLSGLRYREGAHQTFGDPEEGQIIV